MDKIAVLVPCYNEAQTIDKVVQDFRKALPEAVIYVCDNNCTDGTAELARKAGAVVLTEHRQGKGNVVRRMFQDIDAECYILVDGDDTYPVEYAPEMAERVLGRHADMVIGDRLSSNYNAENHRLFHSFGNRLVRWSVNVLFHNDMKDIMTGYRALSYEFVKSFPALSTGFETETEMSIHAADKNLYVENVIIPYRDRAEGSVSKLNTCSDGIKVLSMVMRLFRACRPLAFFGWIALLMLLISAGFMVPVLNTYFDTGLVPRFPTLIACGFLALAALQSFLIGIILDANRHKERQDFEFQYHRAATEKRRLLAENSQQTLKH